MAPGLTLCPFMFAAFLKPGWSPSHAHEIWTMASGLPAFHTEFSPRGGGICKCPLLCNLQKGVPTAWSHLTAAEEGDCQSSMEKVLSASRDPVFPQCMSSLQRGAGGGDTWMFRDILGDSLPPKRKKNKYFLLREELKYCTRMVIIFSYF